jgi:hypothetical protein
MTPLAQLRQIAAEMSELVADAKADHEIDLFLLSTNVRRIVALVEVLEMDLGE